MNITEKEVQRLFPNEKFYLESSEIFVAVSRKPHNKQEEERFEKELSQAKILAKNGHMVYLVPETGWNGKKFDAIVDGRVTEFKTITGSLLRVSDNFGKGIKQGLDVFLKIEKPFSTEKIYSTIAGKLKVMNLHGTLKEENLNGFVWVWLACSKNLLK